MNIGIDFDDVIVDTNGLYMAYAQKYTIEELGKEVSSQNDGSIGKYEVEQDSWTKEEYDVFWDKYTEPVLSGGIIKPYAKEVINKLKQEGNKIIVITARWNKELERKITTEFIERLGLKIDKLIMGAEDKGKIAKENNIDVFIDDDMKNCRNVYNQGIKSYVMDMARNRGIADENIKRLYSWPHIYQEITKLSKEN